MAAAVWPEAAWDRPEQRGAQGHDHRGVEAGLLDQQPDGDQAQHGQNAVTGQPLGGAHLCLSSCHKSSVQPAYLEIFLLLVQIVDRGIFEILEQDCFRRFVHRDPRFSG